jgi:hypothetical protein
MLPAALGQLDAVTMPIDNDRRGPAASRAARAVAMLALAVLAGAGCDRGPDAQASAGLQATCEREVAGWLEKQVSLGAAYTAEPRYDHEGQRCLAHVSGGEQPGTRFDTVVEVQHDRILAGCSDAREAVGDTPCQVNGEPVSREAGRRTIDRLTGRK